jgi:methyl-accepting chemotaxis protein
MDQVTQQNAALVEEAAAAAASLQDQAGELLQVVGVFQLDGLNAASAQHDLHARRSIDITPGNTPPSLTGRKSQASRLASNTAASKQITDAKAGSSGGRKTL